MAFACLIALAVAVPAEKKEADLEGAESAQIGYAGIGLGVPLGIGLGGYGGGYGGYGSYGAVRSYGR